MKNKNEFLKEIDKRSLLNIKKRKKHKNSGEYLSGFIINSLENAKDTLEFKNNIKLGIEILNDIMEFNLNKRKGNNILETFEK